MKESTITARTGSSEAQNDGAATAGHGARIAAPESVLLSGRVLLAAGMTALGLISLSVGDFAYQWQPVPDWVAARALLARLCGLILIIVAACSIIPRTARSAALALAVVLSVWLLLLHVTHVIAGYAGAWLGMFEILALAGAAWMIAGTFTPRGASRSSLPAAVKWGRLCFAVSLPAFGISHFVYHDGAVALIPAYIPAASFWVYLTGAAHIAAGISLLSGVLARLGATLLAAMFSLFVLLLHLPRVLSDPGSRLEWTMLFVALSLSGAAWAVAGVTHRLLPRRVERASA